MVQLQAIPDTPWPERQTVVNDNDCQSLSNDFHDENDKTTFSFSL